MSNYSNNNPDFRRFNSILEISLYFHTNISFDCNCLLIIRELMNGLQNSKKNAPGSDNMPNEFLLHLPIIFNLKLLALYNDILITKIFPKKKILVCRLATDLLA